MNPQVDKYISKAKKWRKELEQLRAILLTTELKEELKWWQPCYTFQKANVVILGELNDCCVCSFFKGVLLKDPKGILSKPGSNTQSARIIRFTSVQEIIKLTSVLKSYISEAISVEKAGLKAAFPERTQLSLPTELQHALDKNPAFKKAFQALTPGRQRAYVLYFSAPKQIKTRESRIDKFMPKILLGKGFNDY